MSYVLAALSCLLLVLSAPHAFADDPESATTEFGGVGEGCSTDGYDDENENSTPAETTLTPPETTPAGSRAGKVVHAGSRHKAHARTAAHGKAAKARTAAKKAGRTAGRARKA